MADVSIVDFGSFLPPTRVPASYFFPDGDPLAGNALLRAPDYRHHVQPDERAAEMIEAAARPMLERIGVTPASVDILITNVLLPDNPITGSGAETAHLLGCTPTTILDLHNGGCAAFPFMLKLVKVLMDDDGSARSALLCTVQNGAGKLCALPEARKRAQAAVPGDGCGVAYVVAGARPSPVLAVETNNLPASALDMGLSSPDGRKYWEPGSSELGIVMNTANLQHILEHGNHVVPSLVTKLCHRLGVKCAEIDVLVTNQPNRVFLDNWRSGLGIDPARHLDTFDQFGNLMSATVAVTLDDARRNRVVRDGDLVVVAGFAHAGDFSAAAAFRWASVAEPIQRIDGPSSSG